MEKKDRSGKRLRLTPLLLGGYGAVLGFGLAAIGFAEMKEGIGLARLVMGIGLAGFGLLGIWDGVRDLARPDKKPGQAPGSQFILTDTSQNRSSLVTPERLREQIGILAESGDPKRFDIRILPPLSAGERGLLKQVLCLHHGNILLAAFFEMPEGGYRICRKSTEPDSAAEWLEQLLAGRPDFSGWENIEANAGQDEADACSDGANAPQDEADACSDETDALQESAEAFWRRLRDGQKGQMACWHQLLVIFGESWHDEHKFFSAADVGLAVEGIHEGEYTKAVLEWGTTAFDLFPGVQNDLMVIWRTNNTGKGDARFLAREGTVTQVKFWLVRYLERGFFEEISGWADVTAQIESITTRTEKEERKGKKKHGNVL